MRQAAFGRAVDHVVDRGQHIAEVVVEVGTARRRACANTKSRYGHVLQRAQCPARLALLQPRALVAALQRHRDAARRRACRSRRGTGSGRTCPMLPHASVTSGVPLVRAAVVEHADRRRRGCRTITSGRPAISTDQVVAGVRHLARVADVESRCWRRSARCSSANSSSLRYRSRCTRSSCTSATDARFRPAPHGLIVSLACIRQGTSFHWPLSLRTMTTARWSEAVAVGRA